MPKLYRIKGKKKEIIVNKVVVRRNMFTQGFGLMLKKSIRDEAHIFPFRKSLKIIITTWFMRFPIDLIYANNNGKVIETVESLKPWKNYFPKKEATIPIELPAGTIRKFNIKPNDVLGWA